MRRDLWINRGDCDIEEESKTHGREERQGQFKFSIVQFLMIRVRTQKLMKPDQITATGFQCLEVHTKRGMYPFVHMCVNSYYLVIYYTYPIQNAFTLWSYPTLKNSTEGTIDWGFQNYTGSLWKPTENLGYLHKFCPVKVHIGDQTELH